MLRKTFQSRWFYNKCFRTPNIQLRKKLSNDTQRIYKLKKEVEYSILIDQALDPVEMCNFCRALHVIVFNLPAYCGSSSIAT